jgi:hypothetical protein
MSLVHLKPCMSRAWPLGNDGSVMLSVVAQALLCIPFGVHVIFFPLPTMPTMAISGRFRPSRAGLHTGTHPRLRVCRGRHSPLGRGECTWLMRELLLLKTCSIFWSTFGFSFCKHKPKLYPPIDLVAMNLSFLRLFYHRWEVSYSSKRQLSWWFYVSNIKGTKFWSYSARWLLGATTQ